MVKGSARVSRAGFGVAPKQSFVKRTEQARHGAVIKVRECGTPAPARETRALPRRLHFRQMRHAIFFAVARHAEIEIRIA